jgi:hypothetical protein
MKIRNVLLEAVYPGNIGAMEVFQFYKVATPEQKQQFDDLIANKDNDAAWNLVQDVTGVVLHKS